MRPDSCIRIQSGDKESWLSFNPTKFNITKLSGEQKEIIDLGYSAAKLLEKLLQYPGSIVAREELIEFAWSGRVVGQGSLNQQIYTLRQILGDEKSRNVIQTIPRRGYLFNPEHISVENDSGTDLDAVSELPFPATDPSVPVLEPEEMPVSTVAVATAEAPDVTQAVAATGSVKEVEAPSPFQPLNVADTEPAVTLGIVDSDWIKADILTPPKTVPKVKRGAKVVYFLASVMTACVVGFASGKAFTPVSLAATTSGQLHVLFSKEADNGKIGISKLISADVDRFVKNTNGRPAQYSLSGNPVIGFVCVSEFGVVSTVEPDLNEIQAQPADLGFIPCAL